MTKRMWSVLLLGFAISCGGGDDNHPPPKSGDMATRDMATAEDMAKQDMSSMQDMKALDMGDMAPSPDMAADMGTTDMSSGGIEAPKLDKVDHPSHGTFKLSWTNPSSGCDMIEIDSKVDSGSYKSEKTIAGTTTSYTSTHHDATMKVCYQLICQKGGMNSAPSNEICKDQ